MKSELPKYPYTGRRFVSFAAFIADDAILPYLETNTSDGKSFIVNPEWIDAGYYEVLDYSKKIGYHQRLKQI